MTEELVEEYEVLLTKKEDLHPDLVPFMEESESWGHLLKHPLVFSVPYNEIMNAFLNKQYEYKKNYIEECITKKNWSQYIFMHERPYRVQVFQQIKNKLTDIEYWDLLGSVWTDSENIWQNYTLFKRLLQSKRPHQEHLMDEEDRGFLDALPGEIRVYRGHMHKNKRGLSWSLSSHTAGWFAYRFGNKKGGVVTGLVCKDKIKALLLGRSEFEVVVEPKDVRDQKPFSRVHELSDPLREVFQANWAQAPLAVNPRTAHGIHHWHKVDYNGIILASMTPGVDLEVVRLFSAFHDSRRINENHDPKHGARAAEYLREQVKNGVIYLKPEQVEKLVHACRYHERGMVSDDPTIGTCWDADRLDLIRVGVIPMGRLLSTQAGKDLICKI